MERDFPCKCGHWKENHKDLGSTGFYTYEMCIACYSLEPSGKCSGFIPDNLIYLERKYTNRVENR